MTVDPARHVLDGAPVFVYALDKDLRYVYLNPATLAAAYGGRRMEEVVGRSRTEFLPPEDVADLEANDRKAMDTDRTIQVYESVLGRILLTTKWPMHDDWGNVIGVAGVSTDITSVIEERVRGSSDLDLMVKLMENTSTMTRSLTRMFDGRPGR